MNNLNLDKSSNKIIEYPISMDDLVLKFNLSKKDITIILVNLQILNSSVFSIIPSFDFTPFAKENNYGNFEDLDYQDWGVSLNKLKFSELIINYIESNLDNQFNMVITTLIKQLINLTNNKILTQDNATEINTFYKLFGNYNLLDDIKIIYHLNKNNTEFTNDFFNELYENIKNEKISLNKLKMFEFNNPFLTTMSKIKLDETLVSKTDIKSKNLLPKI